MEFVSWDYSSQDMEELNMFQTTNQWLLTMINND